MTSDGDLLMSVRNAVSNAFDGVCLGSGVSIRQTEVIDRYGEGCTAEEFAALPKQEVTHDWTAVPDDELKRISVGHLDPEGYRYYIPALLLSLLRNYDAGSMRVIGTLSSLDTMSLDPWENGRPGFMHLYSALSESQQRAVAFFLTHLPQLVELEPEHSHQVARALGGYWSQHAA
jgi:hypothetical protein